MQQENKKHYAWKIMLACIFMKMGTGGASMAMIIHPKSMDLRTEDT